MGKRKSREMAREERHGPSCMCRRCRARDEALDREKTRKKKRFKEHSWNDD